MAKKKPKKRRQEGFPAGKSKPVSRPQPPSLNSPPPRRWGLIILFLTITIGGTYLAIWLRPKSTAPRFTYTVIKKYPHDQTAFTQGLVMHDGCLWESTGRYGESTMRRINLSTGEVLNQFPLGEDLFGEGMTVFDGKFYQITWKEGKAFVYTFADDEFQVVKEFEYEGEGWGLTHDDTHLIFSDGSREIKFLDPETFEEVRSLWVKQRSGAAVGQLNELEFYQGKIYANRYQSDLIYEIDPQSGYVTKVIDLNGLWTNRPADGVLNGIAVNQKSGRLLVTGKLCPFVFEVKLAPILPR
ncbi:MAG: glutaminyl-peptide cyclotransferase [Planctomycetota bacterium]